MLPFVEFVGILESSISLVSSFRAKSRNLSCTALICSDARIGNRCLIALLFSCPMEVVSLGMTNGEALTP